ncbi:MAG: hypothetical protein HDS16_05275 [Bacteroides sp.]|nr:hypothetical protein [Bacteroides sp.]
MSCLILPNAQVFSLPLASTLPNKANLSARMVALDNIVLGGWYDHIPIPHLGGGIGRNRTYDLVVNSHAL